MPGDPGVRWGDPWEGIAKRSTDPPVDDDDVGAVLYYYVARYIARRNGWRMESRFTEPSVLILTSLAGGPKHGYALIKDIEELAGTTLGPGTLYGALARLERRGLVEALPAQERRRPYRITPAGARTVRTYLEHVQHVSVIGLKRLAAFA